TMSPQLLHVVTAIAFLLVTSHAGDHGEGIQRIPGKPGLNELPIYRYSALLLYFVVFALDETITTFGKKMFATNGQEVDFETTLEACKQAGGSIASPRNKGENDAVFSIVRLFNRYAYLGIKGGGIPGKFSFLDGTAVNYTNLHAGEPSDIGEENCMEMCTDGAWKSTSCNQNRLTICEFYSLLLPFLQNVGHL
uniref:C-type lectin domain-containing protein n=1 Tax=Chelonoidis abingdonii TaxID=106734 RepID=A0A8C0J1N2_CHEAB